MKRFIKQLAIAATLAGGIALSGTAAGGGLGEAATNPVSNLIQFRLQNQHSWENYNADSWSNAMLIQTVVPLTSIANKFDGLKGVVTRATGQ